MKEGPGFRRIPHDGMAEGSTWTSDDVSNMNRLQMSHFFSKALLAADGGMFLIVLH